MRVISSMEITPASVSSEAKNLASMFAGEIKIPKNQVSSRCCILSLREILSR